jgi:sulfite reductase beta subunit-like hemoprotein
MSAIDDPKTLGRARLSFADQHDIDEFLATLEKFERGEIGPDQWRAFRLVRGTYGQRQDGDVHMLRVKVPQGVLDLRQLYALATVAETYSRGFGHITTRQNIQFHFVKLHDVELAMQLLADVGVTTREACGNSVRNITCCPYAGVAKSELFDVTPFADALTRYLLRHPLSSSLPRKFKIAFEGCPEDHAFTAIHDIGLKARVRRTNGGAELGFRITVGGGTATMCRSGHLLHEFAPAGDLLDVAEAIVRVFHRLGDHEHTHMNRMKFLIKALGWEGYCDAYEKERERIRVEGGAKLSFSPNDPPVEHAPTGARGPAPSPADVATRAASSMVRGPGITPAVKPELATTAADFARWERTNVRPQKQEGYSTVTVTIPLGDFTGQQMRVLADLAGVYGDGLVRVTQEQDLLFRWIRNEDVDALFRRLAATGLAWPDAGTIADVTSCPGAESCKLAVTQSRGLGDRLGSFLRSRPDLVAAATDLQIKISGCPNGCGLHHIAGIGFQGGMRKVGTKIVPQYFVTVGGAVHEDGARFGRTAAKIPARRIPVALERLITLYLAERAGGETATAFFERIELARVKPLLADLEVMTPESAEPQDYVDLAEETEFHPEIQEGECSA